MSALKDYVRGRSLSQINNLDLWLLTPALPYRPYEWNRTAMEQLKSAGALRQIDNTELVEKITAYEELTRHLDEDYITDKSIFETASNMNDVKIMVNKYDKVALLEARVHSEVPMLIRLAEELIQLLRTEYSLDE